MHTRTTFASLFSSWSEQQTVCIIYKAVYTQHFSNKTHAHLQIERRSHTRTHGSVHNTNAYMSVWTERLQCDKRIMIVSMSACVCVCTNAYNTIKLWQKSLRQYQYRYMHECDRFYVFINADEISIRLHWNYSSFFLMFLFVFVCIDLFTRNQSEFSLFCPKSQPIQLIQLHSIHDNFASNLILFLLFFWHIITNVQICLKKHVWNLSKGIFDLFIYLSN